MSSNIFRIFNPNAEKEDPGEKRKGQLRRAQRTYRDRKDRYIKSLEGEVQRAAHRETKLVREVESLRENVELLTELLSQYGIPTPSQSPGDTGGEVGRPAARPQALDNVTAPEVHPAQPQKQKRFPAVVPPPDDGGRESPMAMGWTSLHAYPEGHRTRAPMNQPPLLGTSKQASDMHGNSLMQNADLVAVAMDFVLTLERPCLGHLHGDPTKPDDPTGHVLTTSAQLHFASSGPVFTPPGTVAVPSYEHTPEDVLDRLLDLAPGVCSEGEVTPVQAWRYVRDRPYFGGLDALSLRRLTERLRGVVKCYGFGAVVEVTRLESAVYETLIVGRLF